MLSRVISRCNFFIKSGLLTIFFMGFASGFPFALTASVLSARLKESNISISHIGLFTLVAVPYSFKYIWAPFVDSLRLPILQNMLGRRRGWLFAVQVLLMITIFIFGMNDPANNLMMCAVLALCITFLSSTQDIIIDAYRIERLTVDLQGMGAAVTTYGYRVALFIAGVLPLAIAEYFSWELAYIIAALFMTVGMLTTFISIEPSIEESRKKSSPRSVSGFLLKTFVNPFKDLLSIDASLYILAFVLLFKLGDAMAGIMTTPFLLDKGFTKMEIVAIVKTYGLIATFAGVFVGGMIAYRVQLRYSLLIAGLLQMLSNLLFIYQDYMGHDQIALIITITGENFTSGIGGVIMIAYLSSLCNIKFAATQYALLSALVSIARNVLSSFSGFVVDYSSWSIFFLISTIVALPALLLIPKITFFKRHRTS